MLSVGIRMTGVGMMVCGLLIRLVGMVLNEMVLGISPEPFLFTLWMVLLNLCGLVACFEIIF